MVWPIEDQAHHLHLAGCAILSLGDLKSGDEGRAVDQLMTVRLQKGSLWGQVLQPDASHDGGAADEGIGRVAHAFMLLVELCKLRRDNALAVLDRCGLTLSFRDDDCVATTPTDWHSRFPGSGGSLYGGASHGLWSSFTRSGARSRLKGLYLSGGSVHPGPGVPMATLSGRLAARTLLSDII